MSNISHLSLFAKNKNEITKKKNPITNFINSELNPFINQQEHKKEKGKKKGEILQSILWFVQTINHQTYNDISSSSLDCKDWLAAERSFRFLCMVDRHRCHRKLDDPSSKLQWRCISFVVQETFDLSPTPSASPPRYHTRLWSHCKNASMKLERDKDLEGGGRGREGEESKVVRTLACLRFFFSCCCSDF